MGLAPSTLSCIHASRAQREISYRMVMPNFLIIGAMKSGTTALYQYLNQHPQIYMSPVKEPNFFAFEGEKLDFRAPLDRERINRVSITDLRTYQSLFDGVSEEKAFGEASHWYLYSSKAPKRIHHHVPDAKLIAILRNPTERAFSDFMHFVRDGHEPFTDFVRALEEEETRIRANWAMGHYVARGFYHAQLKRYYDIFDADQIKIYLYEDLKANSAGVLEDVLRFLEVDKTFALDLTIRPNVSGVPRSKVLHSLLEQKRAKAALKPLLPDWALRSLVGLKNRNLVKPRLRPEVRRQLVEVYREDILALQDLIGRDLSQWLK
jgi:hypothetical protein